MIIYGVTSTDKSNFQSYYSIPYVIRFQKMYILWVVQFITEKPLPKELCNVVFSKYNNLLSIDTVLMIYVCFFISLAIEIIPKSYHSTIQTYYLPFTPYINTQSFVLGSIHKLRWQAREREGLPKCQRLFDKLENEGGGGGKKSWTFCQRSLWMPPICIV